MADSSELEEAATAFTNYGWRHGRPIQKLNSELRNSDQHALHSRIKLRSTDGLGSPNGEAVWAASDWPAGDNTAYHLHLSLYSRTSVKTLSPARYHRLTETATSVPRSIQMSQQEPDQTTKQDPVKHYPKPPFERQPQEAPGSVHQMRPAPDHGEHSYRGSGRLKGRKALITGADSGIGRAVAIAFAREGADVALNYLPAEEEDAREVVELIQAAGRKAVALPSDITSEAFCQMLVQEAATQLGGLDILVNNAGKQTAQDSIAEVSTEQFDATFKTNVYALFWITKAALPHLGAGASIINTSSIQASQPSPNLLDYASTKTAIVAFTQALAQ